MRVAHLLLLLMALGSATSCRSPADASLEVPAPVETLGMAVGVFEAATVFETTPMKSVGSLTLCGPGLVWRSDSHNVHALMENESYPLVRRETPDTLTVSDLLCPRGGGILVALRDGSVIFSETGLPFSVTAFAALPVSEPKLAAGVGDELWAWSARPGRLAIVEGGHSEVVYETEQLLAVVPVAPRSLLALEPSSASVAKRIVLIEAARDSAPRVRTLATVEGGVDAMAVANAGRVFLSDGDSVFEYSLRSGLKRVVSGTGGSLVAWGNHVAVHDLQRNKLVVLRLSGGIENGPRRPSSE